MTGLAHEARREHQSVNARRENDLGGVELTLGSSRDLERVSYGRKLRRARPLRNDLFSPRLDITPVAGEAGQQRKRLFQALALKNGPIAPQLSLIEAGPSA